MDEIIGMSASAAGGGLFGLLGTTLGRVAGFFEKRQSIAHEERRWQHETTLVELQQKTAMQAAKTALDQAHVDGSWDGLSASLAAQAAIGESYKWVNAIRSLTRPSLTLLLWGLPRSSGFPRIQPRRQTSWRPQHLLRPPPRFGGLAIALQRRFVRHEKGRLSAALTQSI